MSEQNLEGLENAWGERGDGEVRAGRGGPVVGVTKGCQAAPQGDGWGRGLERQAEDEASFCTKLLVSFLGCEVAWRCCRCCHYFKRLCCSVPPDRWLTWGRGWDPAGSRLIARFEC